MNHFNGMNILIGKEMALQLTNSVQKIYHMRVLNYSITETEAVRAISETNKQISTWQDKYMTGTAMECTALLTDCMDSCNSY